MIYGIIFLAHCFQTKLDSWKPGLSKIFSRSMYLVLALTTAWPLIGVPLDVVVTFFPLEVIQDKSV